MQLCFVSVHGPREPYFVDEPLINATAMKTFLPLEAIGWLASGLIFQEQG
jgi:hypothetical protein